MIHYDLANTSLERLYQARDALDIQIAEYMKELERVKKVIVQKEKDEAGKNLYNVVELARDVERHWNYPAH